MSSATAARWGGDSADPISALRLNTDASVLSGMAGAQRSRDSNLEV
jgi:hypothetical protein